MQNFFTLKKIIYTCAIAGVLAIIAIVVVSINRTNPTINPQLTQTNELKQDIVKTEIDLATAPDKFPDSVPIESGVKIIQNYSATAINGTYQATRVFETNKTLDENLKIYTDYLKKNGWTISDTINQLTYKAVFGTKGTQQLQVTLNQHSTTKTKTVSISFIEMK